jgi:hypothetical protein
VLASIKLLSVVMNGRAKGQSDAVLHCSLQSVQSIGRLPKTSFPFTASPASPLCSIPGIASSPVLDRANNLLNPMIRVIDFTPLQNVLLTSVCVGRFSECIDGEHGEDEDFLDMGMEEREEKRDREESERRAIEVRRTETKREIKRAWKGRATSSADDGDGQQVLQMTREEVEMVG